MHCNSFNFLEKYNKLFQTQKGLHWFPGKGGDFKIDVKNLIFVKKFKINNFYLNLTDKSSHRLDGIRSKALNCDGRKKSDSTMSYGDAGTCNVSSKSTILKWIS